jgi:NAD(P)-dependent dehydrogenase (short-subunit alcohol dehydrogenase family)
MKLRDKVSIVTGGAKGIGRAITRRLVEEGSRVVIAQRDPETGEALEQEILEGGGDALFVRTDVSIKEQVDGLVEETLRRFGQIDVLVNNAATSAHPGSLLEASLEDWQRVLNVNLTGVFLCSQAVARHMVERKRGRIINITSVGGFQPWKGSVHYLTSKGGLIMLTKAMALELAPHCILVNAIAPGAIMTERVAEMRQDPARSSRLTPLSKIPLSRFGEVGEIAAAVAFLASDEASYFQGATLVVDGGYLLT